MNRKPKALSLAFVAALALTAVMASAASAQFTSNKTHTIISGSQKTGTNDIFTAGEGFGGITCENAKFNGTGTTTNDADQTITPTYENCKDSFGRIVHVEGSISYTFTPVVTTRTEGTEAPLGTHQPLVHVTSSLTLTVTSGGVTVCTIHILNLQTTNGVSYTNLGGTNGVETTTHATNVKSITTGSFFACGVTEGEHTEGTYDGTAVVTGKDTTGAAAEISVDHEIVKIP